MPVSARYHPYCGDHFLENSELFYRELLKDINQLNNQLLRNVLLQLKFGHESVLCVKHIKELLTQNLLFALRAKFYLQSKDKFDFC